MSEGVPQGSKKEKSPVFLEPEEIALIKLLIEEKKCSTSVIHELTGMNTDAIGGFCKRHGIVRQGSSQISKGGNTKSLPILRARKLALIKAEYGERLKTIRQKYES